MRDAKRYNVHMMNLSNVADIHEAAKHNPTAAQTRDAYEALLVETLAQFETLLASGLKVTFTDCDPYANSADMRADYAAGSLKVYTQADMPKDHPLSRMSKYGVTFNVLFRACHDVFGHALTGSGFGPKGELTAYQAHARMFTVDALPALAAETLAQNAWVNFGPHMRQGVDIHPSARPFAEQKAYAFPVDVARAFITQTLA